MPPTSVNQEHALPPKVQHTDMGVQPNQPIGSNIRNDGHGKDNITSMSAGNLNYHSNSSLSPMVSLPGMLPNMYQFHGASDWHQGVTGHMGYRPPPFNFTKQQTNGNNNNSYRKPLPGEFQTILIIYRTILGYKIYAYMYVKS